VTVPVVAKPEKKSGIPDLHVWDWKYKSEFEEQLNIILGTCFLKKFNDHKDSPKLLAEFNYCSASLTGYPSVNREESLESGRRCSRIKEIQGREEGRTTSEESRVLVIGGGVRG